jgi:glycosyltransferase involved in cell wall biosynthesis
MSHQAASRSMKIRHVIRGRCNPDNADGIIRHTYQLAHAQLRLGHDVAVYGVESRSLHPELIDRESLPVYAYPRTRLPLSLHPSLAGRIDGPDSDVGMVHIQVPHDPSMFRLSRYLRERGIDYFVSPHAMWEPIALDRHWLRKRVYKRLFDDRMNEDAAGVHATAAEEVAAIQSYTKGAPIFVVRNSVDLMGIDNVVTGRNWFRDQFEYPPDERAFVFLGRLDPYQKGLDTLLQAWSIAFSDKAIGHLFIIGPSWKGSMSRLTKLTHDLGIATSVTFTGPLFGKEKIAALRSGDCYIQLSRYETSPYSIQEAFASRLPAILTEETNFATIAAQYGAGWAVTHDPREVAVRIGHVMELSSGQLNDAGQNARLLVEERHSIDRSAARMVDAYRAAKTGQGFDNDD